jgi:imidazolonepropionase-like amidohydrolase
MLGGPGSRNALATLDAGAGIDGIAHSGFAADSTLETMRSRGIYLVPTLRSFEAQPRTPALDSLLAHMRRQLSQGILIAFGTDAGVIPHGRNAREFGALIRHGLGPAAALRSATVDAAKFLGLPDRIGRLGDPLEDPTALERVTFVMRAGHIHRGPSSKAR